MKAFVFGLLIGIVLVPLGVYFYFVSGSAPVATAAGAMPFERTLASRALHARLDKEMPKTVPIAADESAYLAGAQVYREHCGMCHGRPGHAVADGRRHVSQAAPAVSRHGCDRR